MIDLVVYKGGGRKVYILVYNQVHFYLANINNIFDVVNTTFFTNVQELIDFINEHYVDFKLEYYKTFKITEEKARYLIDIKDRVLLNMQIEYINEGNIY